MTPEVMVSVATRPLPVGARLREWRVRRGTSQLELASEAGVSSRHVSFIETGRAAPSRDMVLRLANALDVPQRAQNVLLVSAGLAPEFAEKGLDSPDLAAARAGIVAMLSAYDPYPSLVVDGGWNIVMANEGVGLLTRGLPPYLTERPNALRIALHPQGLAPRIRNLPQWRHHLLQRLRREVAFSASAELAELLSELESYPGDRAGTAADGAVAVPLVVDTELGTLRFLSAITSFGTARELTLSEVSVETFLPADEETRSRLAAHRLSGSDEAASA